MDTRVPSKRLSLRETQIVELASHGSVDKEIAVNLGVSVATVRTYWERVRNKLGAANRAEAIALATSGADLTSPTDPRTATAVLGVRSGRTVCFADLECERLFGLPASLLTGQQVASLVSERYLAFHNRLRRLFDGPEEPAGSPSFSVLARAVGGQAIPIDVTLRKISLDGRPVVLCLIRALDQTSGASDRAVVDR